MEVTVAEMKRIEQEANARGLSYLTMMENAGQAAARLLLEQAPHPVATAAVFCGTGNNGGDGFVLARALRQGGCRVAAVLVGDEPKTADARHNWLRAQEVGVELWSLEALTDAQRTFIAQADAVVDGLYGTGFHGALRPEGRLAAALFNQSAGFKLALDLPSGVAADTGEVAEGAVRADLTVTFHAAKPCHRLAKDQCGTVVVASIGAEAVLREASPI